LVLLLFLDEINSLLQFYIQIKPSLMTFSRKYFIFILLILFFLTFSNRLKASMDSLKTDQKWNFHFQNTVINQIHPAFRADYNGRNSLDPTSENHTSISGTLFFGAQLWKGAEAYFNPEITGGAGFSQTTGIAGFPNGEVYRVSDASPHIYIARFYFKQIFALSNDFSVQKDEINQIATRLPSSYFSVVAGKFSVMDFFDGNKYSHDPRNQFFNWALMGNGAWDYPANTRGYTFGITTEYVKPKWALRFSAVMVPVEANGAIMDWNILRSRSESMEFEHQYTIVNLKGTVRFMTYLTEARMGNYQKALEWGINHHSAPEIDSVQAVGRTKFGFGINIEQPISKTLGTFLRASWNDGKNQTWTFTEIDRHISAGFVLNGDSWKRKDDKLGFAQIVDGLSKVHRDYLKAGGYGFIIGDGNLNYGLEAISEIYYSFRLFKYDLWLTPNYQFILNPAYNKDRGPVHSFGMRMHVEI
jgi:high affinity Mn2+ porin